MSSFEDEGSLYLQMRHENFELFLIFQVLADLGDDFSLFSSPSNECSVCCCCC